MLLTLTAIYNVLIDCSVAAIARNGSILAWEGSPVGVRPSILAVDTLAVAI